MVKFKDLSRLWVFSSTFQGKYNFQDSSVYSSPFQACANPDRPNKLGPQTGTVSCQSASFDSSKTFCFKNDLNANRHCRHHQKISSYSIRVGAWCHVFWSGPQGFTVRFLLLRYSDVCIVESLPLFYLLLISWFVCILTWRWYIDK